MSVALRRWTSEEFLDWAGTQEEHFEFDGVRPVAMTGGTARHSRIIGNLHAALRTGLLGTPCAYFGDLGVATIGNAVRYPDALITCATFSDTERLAPDVRAVFEVISPTSGHTDRIVKVREYAAIPSIVAYVIIESRAAGVTVLQRQTGDQPWTAGTLTVDDVLSIPGTDASILVADLYDGVPP